MKKFLTTFALCATLTVGMGATALASTEIIKGITWDYYTSWTGMYHETDVWNDSKVSGYKKISSTSTVYNWNKSKVIDRNKEEGTSNAYSWATIKSKTNRVASNYNYWN